MPAGSATSDSRTDRCSSMPPRTGNFHKASKVVCRLAKCAGPRRLSISSASTWRGRAGKQQSLICAASITAMRGKSSQSQSSSSCPPRHGCSYDCGKRPSTIAMVDCAAPWENASRHVSDVINQLSRDASLRRWRPVLPLNEERKRWRENAGPDVPGPTTARTRPTNWLSVNARMNGPDR